MVPVTSVPLLWFRPPLAFPPRALVAYNAFCCGVLGDVLLAGASTNDPWKTSAVPANPPPYQRKPDPAVQPTYANHEALDAWKRGAIPAGHETDLPFAPSATAAPPLPDLEAYAALPPAPAVSPAVEEEEVYAELRYRMILAHVLCQARCGCRVRANAAVVPQRCKRPPPMASWQSPRKPTLLPR